MAYHKLLSQSVEETTESKTFFSYYKKMIPPKLNECPQEYKKKKIITNFIKTKKYLKHKH